MNLYVCSCFLVLCALTGGSYGENIRQYICNQKFKGWKIDYKRRACVQDVAVACISPFPYRTKMECLNDFQGRGNRCNAGSKSLCKHGGVCLPVTTARKGRTFKCDCSGTGFYGKRCHRPCPKVLSKRHAKQTACILVG